MQGAAPHFGARNRSANLFLFKTIAHEGLSCIALERLSAGRSVAGLHLVLLSGNRCGRSLEARAHERLALIALQGFRRGVGVARGHFVLLGRSGKTLGTQQQAHDQQRDTQHRRRTGRAGYGDLSKPGVLRGKHHHGHEYGDHSVAGAGDDAGHVDRQPWYEADCGRIGRCVRVICRCAVGGVAGQLECVDRPWGQRRRLDDAGCDAGVCNLQHAAQEMAATHAAVAAAVPADTGSDHRAVSAVCDFAKDGPERKQHSIGALCVHSDLNVGAVAVDESDFNPRTQPHHLVFQPGAHPDCTGCRARARRATGVLSLYRRCPDAGRGDPGRTLDHTAAQGRDQLRLLARLTGQSGFVVILRSVNRHIGPVRARPQ
nr:hypothetical protein [Tanacetum cinerariifolium]